MSDELKINTNDVQMTESARKAGLESIFKDISDKMNVRHCKKCNGEMYSAYDESDQITYWQCEDCGAMEDIKDC